MADQTNVLSPTGKLAIAPTDLSIAFPHGGTDLGIVSAFEFDPGLRYSPIIAQEYGQPVDYILIQDAFIVGVFLREWNDDVLTTMFPNTVVGASSSTRKVQWPGSSLKTGRKMAGSAVKLLYSADRSTHPSLIAYRAVPLIDATRRLRAVVSSDLGVPALFSCIRSGSGNVAEYGRLEDLVLNG